MTSGDCSDTRVVAVFTARADAERAEDLFGWSPIEMYTDVPNLATLPNGKRPFCMSAIKRDYGSDMPNCRAYEADYIIPLETAWTGAFPTGRDQWFGSMWAVDEGEALREANRKLQEILGEVST
jgi:hypothetical protein